MSIRNVVDFSAARTRAQPYQLGVKCSVESAL